MLRDVIIHIANEQPIMADLLKEPEADDVALIVTNLRMMNGSKPVFIDESDSTFVLPIVHVRFVEIHRTSMEEHAAQAAAPPERPPLPAPGEPVPEEAFIQPRRRPARRRDDDATDAPARPGNPDELDEELLRRIHEA